MGQRDVEVEEGRQWARFVQDVARLVLDLREGYITLQTLLQRENTGGGDGRGKAVHPPAPIDLDVVDLLAEIDREIDHLVPLARGALKLGLVPPRRGRSRALRTVAGLRFLGDSIRIVWEADQDTGELIVDTLWQLRVRVRSRTSEGHASYRTDKPCSSCGAVAVVVDARRHRARCTECGSADA